MRERIKLRKGDEKDKRVEKKEGMKHREKYLTKKGVPKGIVGLRVQTKASERTKVDKGNRSNSRYHIEKIGISVELPRIKSAI